MSKQQVDLGTAHTVFKVPKWLYWMIVSLRVTAYLGIGGWLTYFIFSECLFNPDCNDFAVGFFALIALSCFKNCGIPMQEFGKAFEIG